MSGDFFINVIAGSVTNIDVGSEMIDFSNSRPVSHFHFCLNTLSKGMNPLLVFLARLK